MEMNNTKTIQKFLFGEMLDEERFDFEENFISNADLFEEIKVAEDELIEKYVRGWMGSAERSRFEKNFLTTKKRRERVEFSRQMLQRIEEQSEIVVAPVKKNESDLVHGVSIWDRIAALFLTPRFAMAGALGLIIAVLGTWLLYTSFVGGNNEFVKNENNQQTETSTPNIVPKETETPVELPTNNENDSVNINQNQTPNTQNNLPNQKGNSINNKPPNKTPTPKKDDVKIKKTPTPKKTPPIKKVAPNPILALFAGTVRSFGKNNELKLPKTAKAATLQLNIEANDYKTYQAQLTNADGSVLFQRNNLKARGKRINFKVPTKYLKKGDYIIKLKGKKEAGENESVADFQFRVK